MGLIDFLANTVGYAIIEAFFSVIRGIASGIGILYLWVRYKGKKPFKQIIQEMESLYEIGKNLINNLCAGVITLVVLVVFIGGIFLITKALIKADR